MFLPYLLKEFGFSENETAVYFAISSLQKFTKASDIAKTAKIKRITCYVILQNFVKENICDFKKKNSVKYFKLNGSIIHNLKTYLENKKSKLAEEEKKFLKAIPELQTFIPSISVYEGIDEMTKMYENIIREKKDCFSFINDNDLENEMYKFLIKNFIPRRNSLKIKSFVISNKNNSSKTNISDLASEQMLISGNYDLFNGEITVYGKKVLLASFVKNELMGAIIQSESISKMLKSIFDLIWALKRKKDTKKALHINVKGF